MNTLFERARNIVRALGFDVVRFSPQSHPLARKRAPLDRFGVDLVLDVGANVGQYGSLLRQAGYRGQIVSFEPMSAAYLELVKTAAASSDNWRVFNFALGRTDQLGEINVAGNSFSSSILPMLESHLRAAPESSYVSKEKIRLRTLDSVWASLGATNRRIFLKIDTQGYEREVLAGAEQSLDFIATLQLEMSLAPLYEGEMPFPEMYELLGRKGYKLVAIEPSFWDNNTGQLLQVDAVFHRFEKGK